MELTHTIPTESGWYWRLSSSEEWSGGYRTGRVLYTRAEVVCIDMNYKFRNKVVPHVIGLNWRGPLVEMICGRPSYWSAKLAEPEIPAPEYPEESTTLP